jgi:hypothetical protein
MNEPMDLEQAKLKVRWLEAEVVRLERILAHRDLRISELVLRLDDYAKGTQQDGDSGDNQTQGEPVVGQHT